jgi:hypothetical protein
MAQTQKQSDKGNPTGAHSERPRPQKGEHYRCGVCGMEVQVNKECHCPDPNKVHFECCGKELQRA